MNRSSTKRIAVFVPPDFGFHIVRSPATYSLLKLLVADGITIDLFTETQVVGQKLSLDPIHNIYGVPAGKDTTHWTKESSKHAFLQNPLFKTLSRITLSRLKSAYNLYINKYRPRNFASTSLLRRAIDCRIAERQYDYTLAIEEIGLILAYHSLPQVPLIYYSLELYTENHPIYHQNGSFGIHRRRIKELQRKTFAYASKVIIQDHDRAKILFKDLHQPYNPDKVLLFPVSYTGKAHLRRSTFLHERFPDIGKRTILLQFGQIGKVRCSPELMQATRACPLDIAVVFHGPIDDVSYQASQDAQCWLSKGNIPFESLAEIPASADVGLVFYENSSDNNRLIAHASGQLALFLQCGVPVIVDSWTTLHTLVDKYHCGIAVDDPKDIFEAVRTIQANYESYCQGALNCFTQEHDLHAYYAVLREQLALNT